MATHEPCVVLVVPRTHVKTVKTALENLQLLDKTTKIVTANIDDHDCTEPDRLVLTTTMPWYEFFPLGFGTSKENTDDFLEFLDLRELGHKVSIAQSHKRRNVWYPSKNPVRNAMFEAFEALPEALLATLQLTPALLASSFPESYMIYKPLLLLPAHAFEAPPWVKLLEHHAVNSLVLTEIWKRVGAAVGATHVAINAGIPLSTATSFVSSESNQEISPSDNILRSPVNFTPIYGLFGPFPTPQLLSDPTLQELDDAFWVSCTQNGIQQVWAPLYSMFSRGNIREKTRLLTLPSVLSSVQHGRDSGNGCTTVDLYAGIGYFAFSYKRVGIEKVLCWELNPWSIEGLRRGAKKNGWSSAVVPALPLHAGEEETRKWVENIPDADFLIFQQSNEDALPAIAALNDYRKIPPIRHVNLGILPSSRLSWTIAVRIIDSKLGGWIHAHENVGDSGSISDIGKRKLAIEIEMQSVLDGEKRTGGKRRNVKCEHVEKVKTYAPGVSHVVFDLCVEGTGAHGELSLPIR